MVFHLIEWPTSSRLCFKITLFKRDLSYILVIFSQTRRLIHTWKSITEGTEKFLTLLLLTLDKRYIFPVS